MAGTTAGLVPVDNDPNASLRHRELTHCNRPNSLNGKENMEYLGSTRAGFTPA
jgi:hypothetical protein